MPESIPQKLWANSSALLEDAMLTQQQKTNTGWSDLDHFHPKDISRSSGLEPIYNVIIAEEAEKCKLW